MAGGLRRGRGSGGSGRPGDCDGLRETSEVVRALLIRAVGDNWLGKARTKGKDRLSSSSN